MHYCNEEKIRTKLELFDQSGVVKSKN